MNTDRPWNASEAFMASIIEALSDMRECRKQGDYAGWHRILMHLVDTCSFEWENKEISDIDDLLQKSKNQLNTPSKENLKLNIPHVEKVLSTALRKFMKGLQKRQRIFYNTEQKSFDDEIKSAF